MASLCSAPAAADEPPAVPIADLPPLPDVPTAGVDDLAVTSATEAEEELVVGASKREQSLGTVASAVTVISRDRLRRWGYRTLAEALRGVVGVYMVDDRAVERMGIRGLQLLGDLNTRILILIDGTPLNEPWQQFVDTGHALPVLIDDVDRIEVIRGPVSSVYGTNAFFGIINIVTLDADRAPRVYGRLDGGSWEQAGASASFAVGDVNRQVRGFAGVRYRGGESLRYPEYNDVAPRLDDGTEADGAQAIMAGLVVHHDRLFFQVRAAQRQRELPGAPYSSNFASPDNRNSDRVAVVEGGYAREVSREVTLTGRLFVNHYRHQTDLDFSPFTRHRTVGSALWLGGELRALANLDAYARRWIAGSHLSLTAGTDLELARTDADSFDPGLVADPETVAVERDFNIQGIYTELDGRTPVPGDIELGATVGLRYDRNSEFDNKLSPRSALFLQRANRYGIKLLYARGFRNPSIFEAFFDDNLRFRPTCWPACESGTTLSPEQIRSFEAVAWARPLPGVKVRVSAWHWKLDRLIEKLAVFDPRLLGPVIQFGNIFVDVTSRGAEVEASYRDTRGWLGFASATWARVRRGTADAANAPELTARLGVSSPAIADRFHLSSEAIWIGSRLQRDTSRTARGHLDWNAAVYLPSYRGVEATLGIRNLLGTRAQIPTQADYDRLRDSPPLPIYLVPGAGRELFVRLGYAFE